MGREPKQTGEILDAVALLVVDMQGGFLNAIPDADAVVDRCAFAIESAHLFGIDVLFTEQVPAKLGHTIESLRRLAPDAPVFQKDAFPALEAGGLRERLRKRGVYHLLLAGIETPICVYQTALQAQDADLDVTVMADCVSARRADDNRTTLEALSRANCHILPSEAIFYSMLGTAANPRFREFTGLVKHYNSPEPLGAHASRPQPKPKPRPEPAHEEKESGTNEIDTKPPARRRSRGRGRTPQEARPQAAEETKVPSTEGVPKADAPPSGIDNDKSAESAPHKKRSRRGGAGRRGGRSARKPHEAGEASATGTDHPASPNSSGKSDFGNSD